MSAAVARSPGQPALFGAMLGAMLRRLVRRSIYLLTGFPLALAAFVAVVTGLSLGAGLLITVVGIFVLTIALVVARGFATVERARLVLLMDSRPAPMVYRRAEPGDGWLKRVTLPLRDPQSWRDAIHALVAFPVAVAVWVVAVTWWTVALGGLSYLWWGWTVSSDPDNDDLPGLLGLGSGFATRVIFWTAAGALAAVSLPLVIAGASRLYATIGEVLLVAPARRRHQVDSLIEGRDATRAAEQSSLRRLERDIHDGPQQRLVRLSMDLGRAQKKAADGSPELATALEDARRQTQDALDELRALSRGIAPPILIDRGLHSGLEELTVRSPIPTTLLVDLGDSDLAPHVESTIYFVASEALANAAKHSGATSAGVRVAVEASTVTTQVSDDGVGGALSIAGHGLAGLEDRVRAVDGTLTITSPAGGPTVVTAEIPCG